MPRPMPAQLLEAMTGGLLSSHSTLALSIPLGAETRDYYFSTVTLNYGGIIWAPELRQISDLQAALTGDADQATAELQNVDTLLGIEFARIKQYLSGAVVQVGEYWKDLDSGAEWLEVLLTGLITGVDPNEQSVQVTVVPDTYSGVRVGPIRKVQRRCGFLYKGFECGRPLTDPQDCDYTLDGAGGCHGRWGAANKVIRHGGMPYLDNQVLQKIV
jgi:hypothetical protein